MGRFAGAVVLLVLTGVGCLGCGGSQSPPAAPAEVEKKAPEPSATPTENTADRAELTAEACEASGGSVVGDIGDGAIHRPEYRCPSGAGPSGTIREKAGGPIGVEGSVCCPR